MFEAEGITVTRSAGSKRSQISVVDDVRFRIGFGRTLAVVVSEPETADFLGLALQGLALHKDDRLSGLIRIGGTGIRVSDEEQMELRRGGDIGYVPRVAPKKKVGDLLVETYLLENQVDKREARRQAIFLLESIGFDDATATLELHLSEMPVLERTLVLLANAICNGPRVVILNHLLHEIEPTDRLRLVAAVQRLRDSLNCAVVWLTPSLAESVLYADEICVMYASRIVETGSKTDIFLRPEMPYTVNLLAVAPQLNRQLPAEFVPDSHEPSQSGCSYSTTCGRATLVDNRACFESVPGLSPSGVGHEVRCHLASAIRIRFARQLLAGES